MIDPGR
jgi:hypothetical protein